jgi:hypothetical protein
MSNDNLKRAVTAVAVIDPSAAGGTKDDDRPSGGDEKACDKDNSPMAKALIALAERSCGFFHDERGDGYAAVTDKNFRVTLRLRSKAFRGWLTGTFYKTAGRAAGRDALSTALDILEAKATYDSPRRELFNRFGMHEGAIFIDLADERWRAVKVTATGWEILDRPPVMFRRYTHQQALPDPAGGGKLSDIHRHLAIRSNDDKYLLEAYLVACPFSNVPRPAITFHGPQGASKTTTARCIKAITDPSLLGSVDLGKSPADLAQILDHHGVPCLDNLTSIPQWAADMLCRGITGGAFSKRELYSDDSDIILSFMRPIIITGINIPTHAPDLLDRLLLIELERIAPARRVDEVTFRTRFNEDRPRLFGSLLDAIAGTLKQLPNINLPRMARMADFTRIACAYAEYAGIGAKKMLTIIMRHTARQTEEVLAADPVATAIFDFIKKQVFWTGTATELLGLLNQSVPKPRPQDWPRQPNGLTKKMNALDSTFNDVGIKFTRDKGRKNGRTLALEYKQKSPSPSSSGRIHPIRGNSGEDGNSKLTSGERSGENAKCEIKASSSPLSSSPRPKADAALAGEDGEDGELRVLSRPQIGRGE